MSAPRGARRLRWSVAGDLLAIEWRERGGLSAPEKRGFGFRMIERALAADMAGLARIEFAPKGLACRIEASLADAAPRASPAVAAAAAAAGEGG